MCISLLEILQCCSWLCTVCVKSKELLSFGSHTETDGFCVLSGRESNPRPLVQQAHVPDVCINLVFNYFLFFKTNLIIWSYHRRVYVYHVGGNLFLDAQQMAPLIILEKMGAIYWGTDEDPVLTCIAYQEMLLCCSWFCIMCLRVLELHLLKY